MKLTIFNGSPRGKKSNTNRILSAFVKGFKIEKNNECNVYYLSDITKKQAFVEEYSKAENVIIAFPLYIDSMPAIVKDFFERIENMEKKCSNFSLGYIIQSGYPEAKHSKYIEEYLKILTKKLKAKYIGTVIKGGLEGIQKGYGWIFNFWIYKKTLKNLFNLGIDFGKNKLFNKEIIESMESPHEIFGFNWWDILDKTGVVKCYWCLQMGVKVFKKRFNNPYKSIMEIDEKE
jgi:NAD(P)H-dependent FMN reductase